MLKNCAGANVHRARYHSSMLDLRMLNRGNDKLGKLLEDFRQPDPENMHYTELASGMKHFKETEKGRDQMCEAVEKYVKEREEQRRVIDIQSLMKNLKITLDQALDALSIQGEEREYIKSQLQKQ